MTEKLAWFLILESNGRKGIGECSVIPGLSPDFESVHQYELVLDECKKQIAQVDFSRFSHLHEMELLETLKNETELFQQFESYPSLVFGMETAFLNWSYGKEELFFDTDFSQGKMEIPINGLVWMGEADFMRQQMNDKVEQGFNCVKMKVGAIDFQAELDILAELRSKYSPSEMILRVDANGAFTPENVREKLQALAPFDLHSIEQPIAPNQPELMRELCDEKMLPIALDEELIGHTSIVEKNQLLDQIKPQFISLKPSLHGGLLSCSEWIHLAEEKNIGWWMTSALESNVGLACIAQFTSLYPIDKHHGLGTGSLYVNNTESQLEVKNGKIRFRNES